MLPSSPAIILLLLLAVKWRQGLVGSIPFGSTYRVAPKSYFMQLKPRPKHPPFQKTPLPRYAPVIAGEHLFAKINRQFTPQGEAIVDIRQRSLQRSSSGGS